MSISLTTPPPSYAFSADQFIAQFTSINYLQQTGVKSVNKLVFLTKPTPGQPLVITYGSTTLTLVAAVTPDDSGKQFYGFDPGSPVEVELPEAVGLIALSLEKNYSLHSSFVITASGNEITLTARKSGIGYDFGGAGQGTNVVPGVEEIVKPNYSVLFRLFLENADNTGFEQIYQTQLQLLSNEPGVSRVQISDKLHSAINSDIATLFPDQPDVTSILCKKSCRKYYFEFAESYGEVIEVKGVNRSDFYTVLHGGMSTIAQFKTSLSALIAPSTEDKDRFLKQGANVIYTRSNQPQYLYFFNTRVNREDASLIAAVEYADGSTDTIALANLDMLSGRKYAFDLTFDKIKSAFENKQVSNYKVCLKVDGDQISEVRTYYLDYSARNYIRYFLNWSSFGSMDSRVCYGEGETEFELFNKKAERFTRYGDDIKAGKRITFASKLTRSHSISTGWLSKRELQFNADFFLSNFKYRYTGGLMLPISINAGKIPEITDGNNLYAQKFEYEYLIEDHAYTEGDAEDNGEVISGFFFSTPSIVFNPSGFTETDPTVPSWVKSITQNDINKWNSAANPQDLSNFYNKTEIANFFNGTTGITGYNRSNWDLAFSWGNHASAGYALTNGSNAFGTWGININGNAASATTWGLIEADFSLGAADTLNYFVGRRVGDGKAVSFTPAKAQAALNINNGSTLNNNISGSATQWKGNTFDGSNLLNTPATYIMGYDGTNWRAATPAAIISTLNLKGNQIGTYTDAQLYDIGIAKMLRWKNYGDNHVIIDASASTSPTGSTIDNKDSYEPWQRTFPTLMGWNGTYTYGVRVDSARNSDYLQDKSPAFTAIGNTIAMRTPEGYLSATYFNMSGPGLDAVSFTDFVTTAGDGYLRRNSAGAVKTALGLPSDSYGYDLDGTLRRGSIAYRQIQLVNQVDVYFGSTSSGVGQYYNTSTDELTWYNGTGGGTLLALNRANGQLIMGTSSMIRGTNPYIQWQNASGSRLGYIQHATNLTISADTGYIVLANTTEVIGILKANRVVTGSYDSGVAGSVNADNWFRAKGATGLYWPDYNIGLFSETDARAVLYSNSTTISLRLASNGNDTRGFLYADNQNNIGFLNAHGIWNFRTDINGNAFVSDKLTVEGNITAKGTGGNIAFNQSLANPAGIWQVGTGNNLIYMGNWNDASKTLRIDPATGLTSVLMLRASQKLSIPTAPPPSIEEGEAVIYFKDIA